MKPAKLQLLKEDLTNIWDALGIDEPDNIEQITEFVKTDVEETADEDFSPTDVSIALRRFLESKAEPEAGTAQHIADIFIGTGSLSLFKDDTSQGVFGIDSSFIEQNFGDDETIRVREPFNGSMVELIFE